MVLLDVEASEPHEPARVVSCIDNLGLDGERRAVADLLHVDLADVEAHVVEFPHARGDVHGDVRREGLGLREGVPQLLVARGYTFGDLGRLDVLVKILARLKVVELPGDVHDGHLDVVAALAIGKRAVEVSRLRIHEIRRKLGGIASEQGVGQRHITPVEAGQVQPDKEDGERVDEALEGSLAQVLAEERAVGEGERQVFGDERRSELLTCGVHASGDDRNGVDARRAHALELAEHRELLVRDLWIRLLDGQY